MATSPKYYIVESSALPEVFIKVAEAKRLLDTGECATVGDASVKAGISRSAFYKYRDSILPFQNLLGGRIITFQLTLHDEPGILSAILTVFAHWGANILTINQTIPTNSCAAVTISADTSEMQESLENLLAHLRSREGVVRAEVLAG